MFLFYSWLSMRRPLSVRPVPSPPDSYYLMYELSNLTHSVPMVLFVNCHCYLIVGAGRVGQVH